MGPRRGGGGGGEEGAQKDTASHIHIHRHHPPPSVVHSLSAVSRLVPLHGSVVVVCCLCMPCFWLLSSSCKISENWGTREEGRVKGGGDLTFPEALVRSRDMYLQVNMDYAE